MATHTVVKGDTLSGIAKANGISVSDLLELNPDISDPNLILVGQEIHLDSTSSDTAALDDYTDDDSTRFNGLPGFPEVWKDTDTGNTYLVYYPEGMDPPVPLRYLVTSEDVLATYFGDKPVAYDHEYSGAEMDALGAVTFGDMGEIADTTGDPWSGFTIKMERASEAMPWLEDPDVFAIFAAAYLEGRTPEAYEFVGTDWYDTHSAEERDWMTTVAQDPVTAQNMIEENRSLVRQEFLAAGVAVPSEEIIAYIADRETQGAWTDTMMYDQIAAATGGGEGIVLDDGLATLLGSDGVLSATSMVDTVKDLWSTWLGSAYPPSDDQIAKWAGVLRDDQQGGTSRLTEMLRSQRMSLFSEYEDDTLTWNDISGPWKSMGYNVWGVAPEDDDAEFVDIVRMNNSTEAMQKFRQIGLDRGYERVTTSARNALERGMSSGVRSTI